MKHWFWLLTTLVALPLNEAHSAQSIIASTKIERGVGEIGHRKSYGYKRIAGFSRRGNRSQRFEIRHGDCNGSEGWNDCREDRARLERKEAPLNRLAGKSKHIWLGFSIYVPEDFQPLAGGALTSVIQTKVRRKHMPIWQMFMAGVPHVVFSDNSACRMGRINDWRGQWNDVTIYANYSSGKRNTYFQIYRNGELLCERKEPIIHRELKGSRFQTFLKYGIYQAFVSRHLGTYGKTPKKFVKNEAAEAWFGSIGREVKWPFRYDWGVKLPKQVIYFDEMLAGQSREAVDVRIREAKGLRPVD